MSSTSEIKLFISYSHTDENEVKEFIKFLSPLKENNLIQEWYDRKIIAGDDFQDTIDNNLENADIICLFISANFLDSAACRKERDKSFELNKNNNIPVIPIILSDCGWLDDKKLNPKLALPIDGKPISNFQNKPKCWMEVYEGLKSVVLIENKLLKISIKEDFNKFIVDTDLLEKAHSQKEKVALEDIFIYPDLFQYDDLHDTDQRISSEKLVDECISNSKIMLSGEDQSGKTFLAKKLFLDLKEKKWFPIFVSLKYFEYQGNAEKKILKLFTEQYESDIELSNPILLKRLIPILDDFHLLRNKEKFLRELKNFKHFVVIVDNIYTLNFKDENLIKSFKLYKILELRPFLRYELIKKWVNLSDKTSGNDQSVNGFYKTVDEKTELIDHTLGRILSSGIMQAYPFVILSVISYYETFEKPLDQDITSQGYCYQAFIYLYLRKQGVKNDEIDTYVNFLTQVSFYFLDSKKHSISDDELNTFLYKYKTKFNLPVDDELLLSNLCQTKLFGLDNFGNYHFFQPYIYFYFVSKYLAENYENCKNEVAHIVNNLHKNENAYIVIFIAHHSRNNLILDEIILNALVLFDNYQAATLDKTELKFFDDEADSLIKELLPTVTENPEIARREKFELQEIVESNNEEPQADEEIQNLDDELSVLAKDLRRSVKTVEVMGRILKNRAGSLEKDRLNYIFKEAMLVNLRILSSFFTLIRNEKGQKSIISYISSRLKIFSDKVLEETHRRPNDETLEKWSRIIFWNTNFEIVYSYISKSILSLGSDKLLNVVTQVCDSMNTPASFLVKHGILMWYNKNLQIDTISKELENSNYSEISKKIVRRLIIKHSSMHNIDFKDRQRIAEKLKISSDRLLIEKIKRNKSE